MVTEDLTKENVLAWLKERTTVELLPKGSLSQDEESEAEEVEEEEE
jgi:trigger factor